MSTLKAVRLKDEGFRPGALNNKTSPVTVETTPLYSY